MNPAGPPAPDSTRTPTVPRVAIVTGATGQDGALLVRRLVEDGLLVHAVVRDRPTAPVKAAQWFAASGVVVHVADLLEPESIATLIADVQPDEFYNLAGLSSVAASFADPEQAWLTNAQAVSVMLEAVRVASPETRFYQASSSEMFGGAADDEVRREDSPLRPQSPYAGAKAAAHLLCGSYRQSYGLRIACGILFNHESAFRSSHFLTRKVADHVRGLRGLNERELARRPPLGVGNLTARRDWGYAPEFVDGIVRVLRQIEVRNQRLADTSIPDVGAEYRDYVLGTGQMSSVRDLVDRAFAIVGLDVRWDVSADDPSRWSAVFASTGTTAVLVDRDIARPSDPRAIRADSSAALNDLGWAPTQGLDSFLRDMIDWRHGGWDRA